MKLCLLLVTIFAVFFNASKALGCEQYPLTEQQQKYLNELELPLNIPEGEIVDLNGNKPDPNKTTKPSCWLSSDFNRDGVTDFAGIYEYNGKMIRSNGWNLDLVILYSKAGQTKHIVFPYAGQTKNNGANLRQYLALHSPGRMDLRPGIMDLKYPAIVSYRDNESAVVYYWDEEIFSSRNFFVDD